MKTPTISGATIARYREFGHTVQVDERKRIAIIDGMRFRIEGAIPSPTLQNLPPANGRQCELCGRTYPGRSELVGICPPCCETLGGGKHSARGIIAAERGQQ
jgi:hypothetical protein